MSKPGRANRRTGKTWAGLKTATCIRLGRMAEREDRRVNTFAEHQPSLVDN